MPKDQASADCACAYQERITDRDTWVYIWPPAGPTEAKVHRCLKLHAPKIDRVAGGFKIEARAAVLVVQINALMEALSEREAQQTRLLLMTEDREPGFADFSQVDALPAVSARLDGDWLVDVVNEGQLDTDFQPIVHANDPSRIFAHECLLRANRDGKRVPAWPLIESAGKAGLDMFLDRAARSTHVANAAARGIQSDIFINFLPTTIYDPSHCLKTTFEAINASSLDKSRFVFEVVESEKVTDMAHLAHVMKRYREEGLRVALDDVGAGYSSLNLLPYLHPDLVKIDKDLITNVHRDDVRSAVVKQLVELAKTLKIEVIAEGIENEADYRWLARHGVDYLQGFYFGKPDPNPQASSTATSR